jgi:hypothetical protein
MTLSQEQTIQDLIDNGLGDSLRLEDMLTRIRKDKPLYNSDLLYLEKISPTEKPIVFTDKPFVYEKEIPDTITKKVLSTKTKIGVPLAIVGAGLSILFLATYLEILPLCDFISCKLV